MVTHSDEIAAYADRIIGFRDGRIVSDAPVAHAVKLSGVPAVAMSTTVELPL